MREKENGQGHAERGNERGRGIKPECLAINYGKIDVKASVCKEILKP